MPPPMSSDYLPVIGERVGVTLTGVRTAPYIRTANARTCLADGGVAHWLEQRNDNPKVADSIPASATTHNPLMCIRNLRSTCAQAQLHLALWHCNTLSSSTTSYQGGGNSVQHGMQQFSDAKRPHIGVKAGVYQPLGMAAEPVILLVVRPCDFSSVAVALA